MASEFDDWQQEMDDRDAAIDQLQLEERRRVEDEQWQFIERVNQQIQHNFKEQIGAKSK